MSRDKGTTIGILVVASILLFAVGYTVWTAVVSQREIARAIKRAPDGWKQLRIGMGTQQVVALVGYPPSVGFISFGTNAFGRVFPPQEQWHYAFGETGQAMNFGRYAIIVTNGTVASVEIR